MAKDQSFSSQFRITLLFMTLCQYSDVISTAFVAKTASQSVNEQRIAIKIYTLLGNSFSEIREDLHAIYENSCLSNGVISKWANSFKDGRETNEDTRIQANNKR